MSKCEHGNAVRDRYNCDTCFRNDVIDRLERIVLEVRAYGAILTEAVAPEGDTELEPIDVSALTVPF